MKRSACLAALLLLAASTVAMSQASPPSVYPGCAPPSGAAGSTWFVSPTGSDSGDGSAANPWTLGSLFKSGHWGGPRLNTVPYWHSDPVAKMWDWNPNASGPVHPGDTIQLEDGGYGQISIGVYGHPIVNSDWLTFMPAPGARPAISKIAVGNLANKFRFTGLTVRNDGVATGALTSVAAAADIIFDNLDVANIEDSVAATYTTAAQWEAGVTRAGFTADGRTGGSCVTVAGNRFHNVQTGMSTFQMPQLLVRGNEIAYSTRDGIDVRGSYETFFDNFLHDTVNSTDSHQDGFQGQSALGDPPFVHVAIRGNRIFRQLDPNNKFATIIQGINAFNGDWTDVAIIDNVAVTSACQGIGWGTTHYGLIAHNTVIWDGAASGQAGGCQPGLAPFSNTHEALAGSDHMVAINNIASVGTLLGVFQVQNPTTGALTYQYYDPATRGSLASNNLFLTVPLSYWDPVLNKSVWVSNPGVYRGNTLMAVDAPTNVFVNLGRTTVGAGPFDFHMATGSPAIGLGLSSAPELAALAAAYPDLVLPMTDIEGTPLDPFHPTVGAYAYQPPPVCTPDTSSCVQQPPPPPVCTAVLGACIPVPSQ